MKTQIQINENLVLNYKNGFLYEVEKPIDKVSIKIYISGSKYWYKNGALHRDNDLPAIERADGDKYWYKNGQHHRDNDLPAIERADGTKLWYKNGKLIYKKS